MAYKTPDRVQETCDGSGSGSLVLTGLAPFAYRSLSAVMSDGDTFPAVVVHQTLGEWQSGVWIYSTGSIALQDFHSSSTGSVLSFSAGAKDVKVGPLGLFAQKSAWFPHVEDWRGHHGDPSDLNAIQSAIDAVGAGNGGPIKVGALYEIEDTIKIGNGSTGVASTYQNAGLIGQGQASLSSPDSATIIRWVGASDADKAIVEVAGRISGPTLSGMMLDCDGKCRDALVLNSSYMGKFDDLLCLNFRRNGVRVGIQPSGTTLWYSSHNRFNGVHAITNVVNRVGYETRAWKISGDASLPAGCWGNVYYACSGSVYRDFENTAHPAPLEIGYTDSSSFIEGDFTLSWSGIDASDVVHTGTPGAGSGTGYGLVADGTVKNGYPLNIFFQACSIVGVDHIIEDSGVSEIGSIIHIGKTTRDFESPSTHPKIMGYNDRGWYFGDIPISIRGDGSKFRMMQQDRLRYVDFVMDSDTDAFTEWRAEYTSAAEVTTKAFGLNGLGELLVYQGLRSFYGAINDDAVMTVTPGRTEGTLSLTKLGGITQNALVAYDVVGTASIALMASGGSANIAVSTGLPTGTTGVDGKLTIFGHTDGNIYIENRTGGAITVRGTYLS